ncbi:MAG TPA: cytochrome c oxidase subunit II [Gaiellaceae bacterium]|jgi:cytochrome c oxidase subunit 2|nr:cytochrome c oxidase subunit II [Gaiellaceae bacterium]
MRRGSIVTLLGIGVITGGLAAAVALLLPWLPHPASREAGRIDFVFWFVIAICIAIFAVVVAALLYSVVRFRAQPDDHEDGPPIHGHTGLEITWTLIPTVLVTAIAIVSGIVLSRNDAQGSDALRVNVTAQQFTFTFSYPDAKNVTTSELRLPKDRSVELYIRSKDVIHSFWVPEFGQKIDAVPGLVTHLHITPDRLGTYPVECTELCGLGHALMRSQAIVMQPKAFDAWLRKQEQPVAASAAPVSGSQVFAQNNCASCHTLTAAHATGKIGPDLDKLAAYAQQAHQPLAAFVRQSIVSPNAYVQPGYPANLMPQTFGKTLSKQELDGLVQFLVQASKKG